MVDNPEEVAASGIVGEAAVVVVVDVVVAVGVEDNLELVDHQTNKVSSSVAVAAVVADTVAEDPSYVAGNNCVAPDSEPLSEETAYSPEYFD